MSDFNVRLTVRSARILQAIEDKFGTQSEMVRQTRMSQSQIGAFVTMRTLPVGADGWKDSAEYFASALGVAPSEIWPDHMKDVALKRATAEFSIDMNSVKQIAAEGRNPLLSNLLSKAIIGIPDREIAAARMHIEGATLEEIGAELGVTKERARQIMLKGIRGMRAKLQRLGIRSITDAIEATE